MCKTKKLYVSTNNSPTTVTPSRTQCKGRHPDSGSLDWEIINLTNKSKVVDLVSIDGVLDDEVESVNMMEMDEYYNR